MEIVTVDDALRALAEAKTPRIALFARSIRRGCSPRSTNSAPAFFRHRHPMRLSLFRDHQDARSRQNEDVAM